MYHVINNGLLNIQFKLKENGKNIETNQNEMQ